jgi:hemerythrin-like domain-containing protein
MNATLRLLGSQHQEVLARMAAVEAGLADGANLAEFAAFLQGEVRAHFTLEEHALFPVLGRHLSQTQGPLAVMNAEHAAFGDLLHEFAAALQGSDPNRQRACAGELIHFLRDHIAKEDHVLFPMAGQILSPEELREVDDRGAQLNGSQPVASHG